MPELPEVETTKRGIAPHVMDKTIGRVDVRNGRLRYPVPADLSRRLVGRRLLAVHRRGKYLLFPIDDGSGLLIHLGMSGHLCLVPAGQPPGRHDHVDICFVDGSCLRYCDPRRFGMVLWGPHAPDEHPLLARLGPEPLAEEWSGERLWRYCRGRRQAIKIVLMDVATVVGVGNIYASEALFRAGIHPQRAAGRISRGRCGQLVPTMLGGLSEAI